MTTAALATVALVEETRKQLSKAQYELAKARRFAARLDDAELIKQIEVAHRFSHYAEDELAILTHRIRLGG